MKKLICIISLLGFFAIASGRADASVVMKSVKGQLLLEAQEAQLSKVLEKILSKHDVEISGLEGRKDEPVTFSLKGASIEELLKRLFRYLGERNYAFEFADGKLKRVSVLPESNITYEAPTLPVDRKKKKVKKKFGTVVRVKGIIKGSKAQDIGIKKGDLIIAYADVRIDSTDKLVEESRKKRDVKWIEMIVVRDKEPMEFYLERGFIGVRIHTVKIPQEELDSYYAGE